jgi:hypothetical protein
MTERLEEAADQAPRLVLAQLEAAAVAANSLMALLAAQVVAVVMIIALAALVFLVKVTMQVIRLAHTRAAVVAVKTPQAQTGHRVWAALAVSAFNG